MNRKVVMLLLVLLVSVATALGFLWLLRTPVNPDDLIAQADALMAEGKYEEAIIPLRQAAGEGAADRADLYYRLAQCYLKKTEPEIGNVVGALIKAKQLDPANLTYTKELADIYLRSSTAELPQALVEIDRLVAAEPNNPEYRRMMVQAKVKQALTATSAVQKDKALGEALAAAQEAVKAVPTDASMYIMEKSVILLRGATDRFERAEAVLKEAVAKASDKATARQALAEFYMGRAVSSGTPEAREAMLKQAETTLNDILKGDEANTAALIALARVAMVREDSVKAHEYLDRAIKADPSGADAYIMKIQLARTSGDMKAAEKTVNDALAAVPAADEKTELGLRALRAELLRQAADIAVALSQDGDEAARKAALEKAKGYLKDLDALFANLPAADFLRGKIAFLERRFPEALSAFQSAVSAQQQRTVRAQQVAGGSDTAAQSQVVIEQGREADYRYWLARAYEMSNAPGKALDELGQVLTLLPAQNSPFRQEVYRTRLRIKMAIGATPLPEEIQRSGEGYLAMMATATELMRRSDFAGVVRLAKQSIDTDPKQPGSYLLLAQAYQAMQQNENAEKALLDGLAAVEDRTRLYMWLLQLYSAPSADAKRKALIERAVADDSLSDDDKLLLRLAAAKDNTERMAILDAEVKVDPDNPAKLSVLATVMVRLGRPDDALKLYREAYEKALAKKDEALIRAVWDRVWVLLLQSDRIADAEKWIGDLPADMTKERKVAAALLEMSRMLILPKDEASLPPDQALKARVAHGDSAIGQFEAILNEGGSALPDVRLLKALARAHFLKGTLPGQNRQGEFAAAQRYYQQVLNIQPQDAQSRLGLANIYLALRQYQQAVAQVGEILDIDPGNESALELKSMAEQEDSRFTDAIATRQRLRQLAPENVSNLLALGALLADRNDTTGAEEAYASAQKLAPKATEPTMRLALLEFIQGKAPEADAMVDTFAKDSGGDATSLLAAASYYQQTGRSDRVTEFGNQAVAAKPDSAGVRIAYATLLVNAGRSEDAATILRSYLSKYGTSTDAWAAKVQLADVLLSRADVALSRGDSSDAVEKEISEAQKLLDEVRPQQAISPRVGILTARALLEQGRLLKVRGQKPEGEALLKEASRVIAQVAAATPNFGEIYLTAADIEMARDEQGKGPDRAAALNQLLKISSSDAVFIRGLRMQAQINRQAGDLEKYRQNLRQLLDVRPGDLGTRLELADLDRNLRQLADAARAVNEGLSLAPNSVPLLLYQAEIALARGQLPEAEQAVQKATGLAPDDINTWRVWTAGMSTPRRIGDQVTSKSAEATAKLRELLRTHADPQKWLGFYLLTARHLNSTKEFAESKAILESLLKDHPDMLPVYNAYVETLLAESAAANNGVPTSASLDASRKVLEDAIARQGAKPELMHSLIVVFQRMGRWPAADETAAKLLAQNPRDTTAMVRRSESLLNTEKYDEALDWARKAVAEDGMQYSAMNNIAWINATQKKNLTEARYWVDRALQIAPWHPSLLDTKGWVLYLNGDYPQAIARLEEAAGKAPADMGIVHYHLGMAYALKAEKTQDKAEKQKAQTMCCEELKKAVTIGRADPQQASDYLSQAEEALKKLCVGG